MDTIYYWTQLGISFLNENNSPITIPTPNSEFTQDQQNILLSNYGTNIEELLLGKYISNSKTYYWSSSGILFLTNNNSPINIPEVNTEFIQDQQNILLSYYQTNIDELLSGGYILEILEIINNNYPDFIGSVVSITEKSNNMYKVTVKIKNQGNSDSQGWDGNKEDYHKIIFVNNNNNINITEDTSYVRNYSNNVIVEDGWIRHSSLKINEEITFYFDIIAKSEELSYNLLIDYDNDIQEINENNNIISFNIPKIRIKYYWTQNGINFLKNNNSPIDIPEINTEFTKDQEDILLQYYQTNINDLILGNYITDTLGPIYINFDIPEPIAEIKIYYWTALGIDFLNNNNSPFDIPEINSKLTQDQINLMQTSYEKDISKLILDKYIINYLELTNSKIKYSYEYISIGGDITDYNGTLISNTLNPSIKLFLENTTNVSLGILINVLIWDDNISDYRYSIFTVDYTLPKQNKDTFSFEEFVPGDSGSIIITLDNLENSRIYDNDDIKIYIKTYNYNTEEYSNDFINIGNIYTIALIEKTIIGHETETRNPKYTFESPYSGKVEVIVMLDGTVYDKNTIDVIKGDNEHTLTIKSAIIDGIEYNNVLPDGQYYGGWSGSNELGDEDPWGTKASFHILGKFNPTTNEFDPDNGSINIKLQVSDFVIDVAPPTINLFGGNIIGIEINSIWRDPGYSAWDDAERMIYNSSYDDNYNGITSGHPDIIINYYKVNDDGSRTSTSIVDTNSLGQFVITYKTSEISDKSNKRETIVERIVNVVSQNEDDGDYIYTNDVNNASIVVYKKINGIFSLFQTIKLWGAEFKTHRDFGAKIVSTDNYLLTNSIGGAQEGWFHQFNRSSGDGRYVKIWSTNAQELAIPNDLFASDMLYDNKKDMIYIGHPGYIDPNTGSEGAIWIFHLETRTYWLLDSSSVNYPIENIGGEIIEFDNKLLHKLNIIFDGQYLFTNAKKSDNGNGVVLGVIYNEEINDWAYVSIIENNETLENNNFDNNDGFGSNMILILNEKENGEFDRYIDNNNIKEDILIITSPNKIFMNNNNKYSKTGAVYFYKINREQSNNNWLNNSEVYKWDPQMIQESLVRENVQFYNLNEEIQYNNGLNFGSTLFLNLQTDGDLYLYIAEQPYNINLPWTNENGYIWIFNYNDVSHDFELKQSLISDKMSSDFAFSIEFSDKYLFVGCPNDNKVLVYNINGDPVSINENKTTNYLLKTIKNENNNFKFGSNIVFNIDSKNNRTLAIKAISESNNSIYYIYNIGTIYKDDLEYYTINNLYHNELVEQYYFYNKQVFLISKNGNLILYKKNNSGKYSFENNLNIKPSLTNKITFERYRQNRLVDKKNIRLEKVDDNTKEQLEIKEGGLAANLKTYTQSMTTFKKGSLDIIVQGQIKINDNYSYKLIMSPSASTFKNDESYYGLYLDYNQNNIVVNTDIFSDNMWNNAYKDLLSLLLLKYNTNKYSYINIENENLSLFNKLIGDYSLINESKGLTIFTLNSKLFLWNATQVDKDKVTISNDQSWHRLNSIFTNFGENVINLGKDSYPENYYRNNLWGISLSYIVKGTKDRFFEFNILLFTSLKYKENNSDTIYKHNIIEYNNNIINYDNINLLDRTFDDQMTSLKRNRIMLTNTSLIFQNINDQEKIQLFNIYMAHLWETSNKFYTNSNNTMFIKAENNSLVTYEYSTKIYDLNNKTYINGYANENSDIPCSFFPIKFGGINMNFNINTDILGIIQSEYYFYKIIDPNNNNNYIIDEKDTIISSIDYPNGYFLVPNIGQIFITSLPQIDSNILQNIDNPNKIIGLSTCPLFEFVLTDNNIIKSFTTSSGIYLEIKINKSKNRQIDLNNIITNSEIYATITSRELNEQNITINTKVNDIIIPKNNILTSPVNNNGFNNSLFIPNTEYINNDIIINKIAHLPTNYNIATNISGYFITSTIPYFIKNPHLLSGLNYIPLNSSDTIKVVTKYTSSHKWYKNNNLISGQTSDSFQINNAKENDSGEYKVDAIDSSGNITTSNIITINVYPLENNIQISTNIDITNNNNIQILDTNILSKDTSSFKWFKNNSEIVDPIPINIYSTAKAFAVLRNNGSVQTWGDKDFGGDSSNNLALLSKDVINIVSNDYSFAAIKKNGDVVLWGDHQRGGSNNTSANLKNIIKIINTSKSFIALNNNGEVYHWGFSLGKIYTTTRDELNNVFVSDIFTNGNAVVALTNNGKIISWGSSSKGGRIDSNTKTLLNNKTVIKVYYNKYSFAVKTNDNNIYTWGYEFRGGKTNIYDKDNNIIQNNIDTTNIKEIISSDTAYTAIKNDNTIVTWGNSSGGGNLTTPISNVFSVKSTSKAFTAIYNYENNVGNIISWGDPTYGGDVMLSAESTKSYYNELISEKKFNKIYSNKYSFSVINIDNRVFTWGYPKGGGYVSTRSRMSLISGVVKIISSDNAFCAIKNDNSIVTWGQSDKGGKLGSIYRWTKNESLGKFMYTLDRIYSNEQLKLLSSGIVLVKGCNFGFTAIKKEGDNYYIISWGQEKSGGDFNLNNNVPTNIEWTNNLLIKSETYNVGESIYLNVEDNNSNLNSNISTII